MGDQKLSQQILGLALAFLLLVGCDAPASKRVPPTATRVRPTATQVPPTATVAPKPLQPTDIHRTPSGPKPTHAPEPTPADLVLPSGVPLYPGAFYFFYAGALAAFASDDSPNTVLGFYGEKLLASGWSLVSVDEAGLDGYSLNWQRGSRRLNVMINKGYTDNDLGSYVVLTWP